MKLIRTIVSIIMTFALLSCAGRSTESYKYEVAKPAISRTYNVAKPATSKEVELAKLIILDQLKDPNSAIFGDIWAMDYSTPDGNAWRGICGFVNAKNSYGGYTGRKLFNIFSLNNAEQTTNIFDTPLASKIFCETNVTDN